MVVERDSLKEQLSYKVVLSEKSSLKVVREEYKCKEAGDSFWDSQ